LIRYIQAFKVECPSDQKNNFMGISISIKTQ